ncbi:MAG: hypothetical protein JSU86_15850 [Phycisphaerales bacterium]|nr:MAG: hypothetical protein JSU86_15850 [Phycisphaerales bacterium]
MSTVSKSGAGIGAVIATVAIGAGAADARADRYVAAYESRPLYARYVPNRHYEPAVSVTYATPPAYLRYEHCRAPTYAIYDYRLPRAYRGYLPTYPDPVYTTTRLVYEVPAVRYVSPIRYRRAVYHRRPYHLRHRYVSFHDYRPLRHHRVRSHFRPHLRSHRHRGHGIAVSSGRPRHHRHQRHHGRFSVRFGR